MKSILSFLLALLSVSCFSQGPIYISAPYTWKLSSIPLKQDSLFPEAKNENSPFINYNRAKLCWYNIDPILTRGSSSTPWHLRNDLNQKSNHYIREVPLSEISDKPSQPGTTTNAIVFNLAYYPQEKGPDNYDCMPTEYSKGIDYDGRLIAPESRWGGIMRRLEVTDFENARIDSLQFWMLDPFIYSRLNKGGDFYINLGQISEDMIKDSIMQDEAGSDAGLNNLNYGFENQSFKAYLDSVEKLFGSGSPAYQMAILDPSGDDYHHFFGDDYDNEQRSILARYKYYNNTEGNSTGINPSTNWPDTEDINRNNTLDASENYFQYRISVKPGKFKER